jgi:hypothetical protein
MSFHNIDLSVNSAYGVLDVNAWGYKQDKVTMYLNGLSGIIIAEIMQIGGILLLLSDKKCI